MNSFYLLAQLLPYMVIFRFLKGPLIANDGPLGPEWSDHQLTGEWHGHRECHIGGDFLLIYTLEGSPKTGLIVFVRTGTHAELFE